jgi:two-component system sensor histidine kinase CpxA
VTRLFWKIFLWFWGAMIVIGLALYFVVLTARPEPLPEPWRTGTTTALTVVGANAAAAWERGGAPAALNALTTSRQSSNSRFWLFDSQGRELSGQPLPRGGRRGRPGMELGPLGRLFDRRPLPHPPDLDGPPEGPMDRGRPPEGLGPNAPDPLESAPAGWPAELPDEAHLPRVADRAAHAGHILFALAGPSTMAAEPIRSASGKRYVIAAVMPRPQAGRTLAEPMVQFVGGLIVLGLSGLICAGLVRYITSPLVSLRTATHRFASGELTARTQAAQQRRRDEVADLGRDFDTMAERIETLVYGQRQLLGDISHELRSPLARLRMALALSRRYVEQGVTGAELQQGLDRIGRETGRLDELIGQLLDLTRLDNEKLGEGLLVQLDALLGEIVTDTQFEARAQHKDVALRATAPCRLIGHRDLLQSALENIIRNAIRYTPEGTPVEVTLTVDIGATIRVRDHGKGVPPEALPHLFTPFYRVETARDRKSGGVGLGLAITERAVRAHGGSIVATNAPDGGLEMTIRLPLSEVSREPRV